MPFLLVSFIIEFSNCINYSGEGDEDDAEVDIGAVKLAYSPFLNSMHDCPGSRLAVKFC